MNQRQDIRNGGIKQLSELLWTPTYLAILKLLINSYKQLAYYGVEYTVKNYL
ncbi:MAG: hypothetical protein SGJ02_05725 [bacterium]|nr:hypothetical protein [bacterium]